MLRNELHVAATLLCLVACDPKVAPESARAAGAGAAPSRMGESCGATAHCASGLACVDQRCRSTRASRLGDYYWEAGRVAHADGKANEAADALARAVSQYETDKLDPPPELLCDTGSALRQKKGDAKAAEQAARFLHRCLLLLPPGSMEAHAAMAELVRLGDQGLDPALLARDETADAYLTLPPKKPPPPPSVRVDEATPHKDRGYAAFVELVRQKAGAPLVKCFTASTPPAAPVTLGLKYRVVLGDDDIVVGARLEVSLVGSGGAAGACAQAEVDKLTKEFERDLRASSGSWQGEIKLSLGPPAGASP